MDIAGSPTITEADVADLDQRALLRSTHLVRQGAQVAFAVAGLLVVAWLWNVVRYQQLVADRYGSGFGSTDIPWTERVDVFAGSLSQLGFVALVGGMGLALRVYGEVIAIGHGGKLTPWEVGQRIDDPDDVAEDGA